MKQVLLAISLFGLSCLLFAQTPASKDTSWKLTYRETPARINNLIHTKLEVKPDFSKSWLYGKAWLTLKPHFYPTDSLTLDAKGMQFNKIVIQKGSSQVPVKFSYNDHELKIKLDKTYKSNESYQVFVDYIAKPDEYEEKYGAGQFLGIKGMYFINPRNEEKDKPTQIWTQGEPESSSAWFPTIDKTNQKTTQELTVTVDNKYVTLSNGKLVSQKKNADGTRSDYWKMDLPHAPYLFFLGVGEYAIVKDKWKGKEVNYYVEKEYAPVAKKIFGNTPEMMTFFSRITGVEYPWVKYSQITGRDYVAGAMENTTATIHQESAQQDARELIDGNKWESTIAHELFHHWFGDYVTTESWSNLTLNESFANYSETLWEEYKNGKDAGAEQNYTDMVGYLQSGSEKKELVRFHYENPLDMFDAVSYNKGGRILHMLRNHIGDSAFFKAINSYLVNNKFKAAEVHQLRLAFEEITGRDLNWFFNQWYFNSGHPNAEISYEYDDANGVAKVLVKQTQKSGKYYKLPLNVDVYNGTSKTRSMLWASSAADTFSFKYTRRPDLINVDADKIMLWTKKDNKTLENFIHQYYHAGNYLDRREAIDAAAKNQDDSKAIDLLKKALNDKYHGLRIHVLNKLDMKKDAVRTAVEKQLVALAKTDPKSMVRGNALRLLGELKKPEYLNLFKSALNDSSYTVAGYALAGLDKLDSAASQSTAKQLLNSKTKGVLENVILEIIVKSGDESLAEKIIGEFSKMPLSQDKFEALNNLLTYLSKINNAETVKWGVDEIVKFRDEIPVPFQSQTNPFINGIILKGLYQAKAQSNKEIANYIKSKLPEEDKKGF